MSPLSMRHTRYIGALREEQARVRRQAFVKAFIYTLGVLLPFVLFMLYATCDEIAARFGPTVGGTFAVIALIAVSVFGPPSHIYWAAFGALTRRDRNISRSLQDTEYLESLVQQKSAFALVLRAFRNEEPLFRPAGIGEQQYPVPNDNHDYCYGIFLPIVFRYMPIFEFLNEGDSGQSYWIRRVAAPEPWKPEFCRYAAAARLFMIFLDSITEHVLYELRWIVAHNRVHTAVLITTENQLNRLTELQPWRGFTVIVRDSSFDFDSVPYGGCRADVKTEDIDRFEKMVVSLVGQPSLRREGGTRRERGRMSQISPAAYLLGAITLATLLHLLSPFRYMLPLPWPVDLVIGLGLLLYGTLYTLLGAQSLKHRGTTVRPLEEPKALVTDGWFSTSRNPMYLGMVLILLGTTLLLGSVTPLVVVVAFAVLLQRVFIIPEEQILEDTFGDAYRLYRKSVRRWGH